MPARWRAFWTVVAAGLVWLDIDRDRRGDRSTWSDYTRVTLRTETPPGRALFSVCWWALAAWYWRHIVRPAVEEMEDT